MCTAGPLAPPEAYCINTSLMASDRAVVLLSKAVLDVDDQLRSHEPHLRYRMTQYEETKRAIEDVEGSVADFARVRSLLMSRMCVFGHRLAHSYKQSPLTAFFVLCVLISSYDVFQSRAGGRCPHQHSFG